MNAVRRVRGTGRLRGRAVRGFKMAALLAPVLSSGCFLFAPPDGTEKVYQWKLVADTPGAALLSVHGTAVNNVFAVGADDGTGPMVLHWDGDTWQRLATGQRGDLWWVYAIDDAAFMAGANATILRYADGAFERFTTPGLGKTILYGVWGSSASDVYAVGSEAGRNGFIWHFDGDEWSALDLPSDIPLDGNNDVSPFFKVWGTSADDVWVVGDDGIILRGNAADGFDVVTSPTDVLLFTVHGVGDRVVAVGGNTNGVVIDTAGGITAKSPSGAPLLQGVCVTSEGVAWATGAQGKVFREIDGEFVEEATEIDRDIQSLHAVWIDPEGGVWTVGGNVLSPPLKAGVLLFGHPENAPPSEIMLPDPSAVPVTECPEAGIDPEPERSIARRWNEQLLNSVRRDIPRPTVHARNLFHVSAALWDAWAAYDDVAVGYLVREKLDADDVDAAREEAISYAAYRILTHRYQGAIGGAVSADCYNEFMKVLGYDPAVTTTDGDSPAALGNRIGQAYIDTFADDGSNEAGNYSDPGGFVPPTPRLTVDLPGSNTTNPVLWQQIILASAVTQNGIPQGAGVREPIGPHWGAVTPFAMVRPGPGETYFPNEGPTELDADLLDATVEVIRKSAELDAADGVMMDVSPGAYGNNPLGTNDGTGHAVNPITGEPYEPQIVPRGDFTRMLAEFWADGPASETPPGHWNTIANDVADTPGFERRLFGMGEELDELTWDVHVYFALNGAVHDAAIAAWELKQVYQTARPITLIRTLAAFGQRSDPAQPSFNSRGLPLVDNLIEVITEESSAPGERHEHLARYVGEIAVRGWRGEPGDRRNEVAGVGWVRALDWIPYQRRTFVTPAFPGFVSGHSTFSRSAAEVMTELTGSAFFPGGLGGYDIQPGWLTFEKGPSQALRLEFGTYYDAADQAGQSRLWGGIHVRQDDFNGRIIGSQIGMQAVELARTYYDGTADD